MVALQIRNVPDEVRDDLVGEARRRGLSLQAYLREVIDREVSRSRRRLWLDEVRSRQQPDVRTDGLTATELVRQYRDCGE